MLEHLNILIDGYILASELINSNLVRIPVQISKQVWTPAYVIDNSMSGQSHIFRKQGHHTWLSCASVNCNNGLRGLAPCDKNDLPWAVHFIVLFYFSFFLSFSFLLFLIFSSSLTWCRPCSWWFHPCSWGCSCLSDSYQASAGAASEAS